MASDLLSFSFNGNEPVDIASWLGDDSTTLLDLTQSPFGDVLSISSPEQLTPLSASPQSPVSPFTNDEFMDPSAIFDFGDINWQTDLFQPGNPSYIDDNTLRQLQEAITQDTPQSQCPSPVSPQTPPSPQSSSSSTGSEGETVNKKKRSHSEIDMSEVCLPRATLLAMSSKEMEEYASKLKQQRPLTIAEEKEFKRQRRLIKNREYASQSRNRKKAYVDDIEKKMSDVVAENAALKEQLQSLANENKTLQKQVNTVVEVLKRAPTKVADTIRGLTTIGNNNPKHKVAAKTATFLAVMFMVLSFSTFLGNSGLPTASPTSIRSFPPSRVLFNVPDWNQIQTDASKSLHFTDHEPAGQAMHYSPGSAYTTTTASVSTTPTSTASSSTSSVATASVSTRAAPPASVTLAVQPSVPALDNNLPNATTTKTQVSFIYNPVQTTEAGFKPASPLLHFDTLDQYRSEL